MNADKRILKCQPFLNKVYLTLDNGAASVTVNVVNSDSIILKISAILFSYLHIASNFKVVALYGVAHENALDVNLNYLGTYPSRNFFPLCRRKGNVSYKLFYWNFKDYHGLSWNAKTLTKINERTLFYDNSMKSIRWMPAGMNKEVCLKLLQLHNHLNLILAVVAIVFFCIVVQSLLSDSSTEFST